MDHSAVTDAISEREQLIMEHLPQIKLIAQRIHSRLPKGVELDDLIGAGIVGLLDAVDKFEAERGIKFKTYAEARIRGAILDSLRSLDWAPRKLRLKSRELEAAIHRLQQRVGRPATDQEIADELSISLPQFFELLQNLRGINLGHFREVPHQALQNQEESEVRYFPFAPLPNPYHSFQKQELATRLSDAIDNLPEREQQLLSLYYE
jgi:RNA polymerase sigma factor for flagellar operon FliA